MNKPRIKMILSVFGESMKHEDFTALLNVLPTATWNKGDSVQNSMAIRKESVWEYSTDFAESYDFDAEADKFLLTFQDKIYDLESYIDENNLESKIDVVIEMTSNIKPGLFINNDLANFVVRIKGSIDIDLYCLDEL